MVGARTHEGTCFHADLGEIDSDEIARFRKGRGGMAHQSEEGEALAKFACRKSLLHMNGREPSRMLPERLQLAHLSLLLHATGCALNNVRG